MSSRGVVYALGDPRRDPGAHVDHALRAIRAVADRLVVVHGGGLTDGARTRLEAVAELVHVPFTAFSSAVYLSALQSLDLLSGELDEIVLTGDSWFGPVRDLAPVFARMDADPAPVQQMISRSPGNRESFPDEGFPVAPRPWLWTAVRREAYRSSVFRQRLGSARDGILSELAMVDALREAGFATVAAFGAELEHDPALFASEELIEQGCPIVDRAVFASYPPFLDRFAVLGREIAETVERAGYPMDLLWQDLARTVPARALNANVGQLSVLPDRRIGDDAPVPRLAVLVHVSDPEGFDDVLSHLDALPGPADVVVTTTQALAAADLERRLANWANPSAHRPEIRVTPANRGRDMSDFLVGCRDILLSDRYDLVVKVHSRSAPRKTVNVIRYFRRYQLENLLGSDGYVRNLLALFEREPRLGIVFPPMMHIGYGIPGRGWMNLRDAASDLCRDLGIDVPLDLVSPLAPFGGMWIARPEALRLLVEREWGFGDYGRDDGRRYSDLARLQERLVVAAAAQLGYYARTVLSFEHAAISHTALDFKVDGIFSTTRGWPVEQIRLFHRGGYMGYGGTVALTRMYLRVNHPRVAGGLRPLYRMAFLALAVRRRLRLLLNGRPDEEDAG